MVKVFVRAMSAYFKASDFVSVSACCLSLAYSNRIHPFGPTQFAFSSIGIQRLFHIARGDARLFQAEAATLSHNGDADPDT